MYAYKVFDEISTRLGSIDLCKLCDLILHIISSLFLHIFSLPLGQVDVSFYLVGVPDRTEFFMMILPMN